MWQRHTKPNTTGLCHTSSCLNHGRILTLAPLNARLGAVQYMCLCMTLSEKVILPNSTVCSHSRPEVKVSSFPQQPAIRNFGRSHFTVKPIDSCCSLQIRSFVSKGWAGLVYCAHWSDGLPLRADIWDDLEPLLGKKVAGRVRCQGWGPWNFPIVLLLSAEGTVITYHIEVKNISSTCHLKDNLIFHLIIWISL